MADHFKLELTNRSSRITIMNNVSENFAAEYAEILSGESYDDNANSSTDNMTWAMRAVLEGAKNSEPTEPPVPPQKNENPKSKYSAYNYAKRMKIRTAKFRTDAYMNFRVPNVQFVTLTFDPKEFTGADDLDMCHNAFKKFIQRIHYRVDDFVYVATFSRQKNNNWHYHMLCNLDPSVKNKLIQDAWRYGLTHSTPLTSYTEFDSRISYCINNMFAVAWNDLKGEKGYLSSKPLLKPIVLRSWKEDEVDSAYEYLSKILCSTDKPLDISSHDVTDDITDATVNISYKISHKVFDELFDNVKVAKLKK